MRKGFLAAITVLLLVAPPARAAQRVILCDTAEQIEQVFALQADGKTTFDDAIESTNIRAGSTNACSKATIQATLLEVVRDITIRGKTYTIIKVAVTAAAKGS